MEDFRDIVGFLIIIIGILLSVWKERKGKNSSGNSTPVQNTLIRRRPSNQQSSQGQQRPAPAQRQPRTVQTQSSVARARQHITEASSLPFVMSSSDDRPASQPLDNAHDSLEQSEAAAYGNLPEEGVRVTSDIPQTQPMTNLIEQEEEQFIEKLREGIILSEILQRKF